MSLFRPIFVVVLPALAVFACAASPAPPPPPQRAPRPPPDPEVAARLDELRANAAARRADAGPDAGDLYPSSTTTSKTSDPLGEGKRKKRAACEASAAPGLLQPTDKHRLSGVWKCVEGDEMNNEYRLDLVQTGTKVKGNLSRLVDENKKRRFDGVAFQDVMTLNFENGFTWGKVTISKDDRWLEGTSWTWTEGDKCVARKLQCNVRPTIKLVPP